MQLENSIHLTSTNGIANMQGLCFGCTGNGSQPLEMNGSSTINVVGDNAQGIFGSYNLTGNGVDISGTYIGTEKKLKNRFKEEPASDGIMMMAARSLFY